MGKGLLISLGLPPLPAGAHAALALDRAIRDGVRAASGLTDTARKQLAEALRNADADRKAALAMQDPKARKAALEKATKALGNARTAALATPAHVAARGPLRAPGHGVDKATHETSLVEDQGALGDADDAPSNDAESIRSLSISPVNPTMDGTRAVDFTATGTDAIGDPIDLSFDVEWTSDKPAVLEIGLHTGKATAGKVSGTARITALHKPSSHRAVAEVTVALKPMLGPLRKPPPIPTPELQSLQVTPLNFKLEIGSAKQLKAMGDYSVGPPQDETLAVVWESTEEEVATVDDKGLVRAVGPGTAKVSATESNSKVIGWMSIEVVPLAVKGLTIESTTFTLLPAQMHTFTALLQYENGSNLQLHDGVTWSSSTPDVVKISGDGTAIGRQSGTADIQASYYSAGDGKTVTGRATVTVPRLVGLDVTPAKPTLAVGQEERFKVVGVFEGGTRGDAALVTWVAANDVISFHGAVAYARRAGTVEVVATHNLDKSVRGTTTVTVVNAKPVDLRIEPQSPAAFGGSMTIGDRMQFRAMGVFDFGNGKKELRPVPVTWSSDNKKVLDIDSKGLASAMGEGKAELGAEGADDLNQFLPIVVKKRPASAAPARPDGLFPPAVTQPFDSAKKRFDALQVEVGALDAIPPFVRKLEDVIADVAKNPNVDAVRDARHARDQALAVQVVMSQLTVFKNSVNSIQRHLKSIEEATADLEGRKKVAELHEAAVNEKERLKSWLEAVEVGAELEENPPAALAKLGTILIDRFHVPAAQKEADELEKELDKKRAASLVADSIQTETDLGTARAAIEEAKKLTNLLESSVEEWRQLSSREFDAADDANGIFNFSEITVPLAQADAIASKSAPQVSAAAEASWMAIEHYRKSAHLENGTKPAVMLKAMGDASLQWRVETKQVMGQAQALHDQLKQMRDAALTALSKLTPKLKSHPKK